VCVPVCMGGRGVEGRSAHRQASVMLCHRHAHARSVGPMTVWACALRRQRRLWHWSIDRHNGFFQVRCTGRRTGLGQRCERAASEACGDGDGQLLERSSVQSLYIGTHGSTVWAEEEKEAKEKDTHTHTDRHRHPQRERERERKSTTHVHFARLCISAYVCATRAAARCCGSGQ
jgi:hypothetical protein